MQQNCSIHDIIHALLTMTHPHATVENIFTFLWCLWKARNDALFCKKYSFPHQIQYASLGISSSQILQDLAMEGQQNSKPTSHGQLENQILQGSTIRSDLLIAGTKVYSDASWQKKNIPGRGYSPVSGPRLNATSI